MHLAVLIRGHKDYQERFINELSSRYLPFPYFNPQTKQLENSILQMRVCPIQLFDIVFPAEQWDAVANTVLRNKDGEPPKNLKKYLWLLRRAMGFKEIPEYKTDLRLPMQQHENLNVFGIGIKEDYWITEDGKHVAKKDKTPLSMEGF